MHTVQPGETLWSIANRYGVTLQELMFLNAITNPNLVYIGQVLRIPRFPPTPVPPTPPAPPTGIPQRVTRLETQVEDLTRRVRRLEFGRQSIE
ncbi:LysM peptidoglycan-binding domain-containing protein [Halalkalibacter alkalisediminis]|uniref:LysM domain-containing protein n=1 Tax=Halalkalibacter alkalisediminis TaxID=935616 RepID=A0ABV6NH84_9BACI|nr:LysM domain-containing protein [Halalkalibacter alkalisediminis]